MGPCQDLTTMMQQFYF